MRHANASTTPKSAPDVALAANQDPIDGVREKGFEALFTRIVNLAPAPVGLGERWKKASG